MSSDLVQAAEAVRHHYDVGNAFYDLWLDDTRTYSCALREGPDDTLESAQERKLASTSMRSMRATPVPCWTSGAAGARSWRGRR